MRTLIPLLVLAYLFYILWQVSAAETRAAANRLAKRHLIALLAITVLVLAGFYLSALFALNGPAIKLL